MEQPVWAPKESRFSRWSLPVVLLLALAAMYRFVTDADQYFTAIWSNTILLLAGCTATVLLALIEKYVLKKPLSLKWEIAILVGFVFFAGFRAWQDQLNAANLAKQSQQNAENKLAEQVPKLHSFVEGEIYGHTSATDRDDTGVKGTSIVVFMDISNTGTPSIVRRWNLTMRMTDGRTINPAIYRVPRLLRINTERGYRSFPEGVALYEKTIDTPIPNGAEMRGMLLFGTEEATRDQLTAAGNVGTITFEDVTGKPYQATFVTTGIPKHEMPYIPGINEAR